VDEKNTVLTPCQTWFWRWERRKVFAGMTDVKIFDSLFLGLGLGKGRYYEGPQGLKTVKDDSFQVSLHISSPLSGCHGELWKILVCDGVMKCSW